MKTNIEKPKRDVRSFEPDEDVAEMLNEAISEGLKLKDIMNTALRENLPKLMRDRASSISKKADHFERKFGKNPTYSDALVTNSSRPNPLEIAAKRLAESFSGSEPKSKASR